jgi:hypothetical protein
LPIFDCEGSSYEYNVHTKMKIYKEGYLRFFQNSWGMWEGVHDFATKLKKGVHSWEGSCVIPPYPVNRASKLVTSFFLMQYQCENNTTASATFLWLDLLSLNLGYALSQMSRSSFHRKK